MLQKRASLLKKSWICTSCFQVYTKWSGQCPKCQNWNTIEEEREREALSSQPLIGTLAVETTRYKTSLSELDRLLGGGIVKGSLVLVGGDPGIGKSTLLLQLAHSSGEQVLYVSAEESFEQTFMRSERLGIKSEKLFVFSDSSLGAIQREVALLKPSIVIIDSIQMLFKEDIPSSPGSVLQVKECATELMHLAKREGIAIFLVGHVTKGGEIAGPRVLEHLVDTVLYFEGEKERNFRFLRVVKNRFGSSDEIAVFQMQTEGLVEICHPSQLFLEERSKEVSGSSIVSTLEGSRPFLVEVQALISKSGFATPSRRSSGIDPNRLALLLAVLEKRLGYALYSFDVFVSVVGGMKVKEPAVDLGVMLSIVSSYHNRPFPLDLLSMGEVGLGGEVRSVMRLESRLKEAIQMGFKKALIPKRSLDSVSKEISSKIELLAIEVVDEAIDYCCR